MQGLVIHLMGVYLILWLVTGGLSYALIGAVSTLYLFIIMLFDIPFSAFSDKYGRLKFYVLGGFIYGLGLVMLGLIISLAWVIISYVIMAVGVACSRGALETWVYDSIKDEKVAGKLFSRQQALNGMAGVIGGLPATSIYTFSGMMNMPIIAAGVLSILLFISLFFLPDNVGV
jgi:MFS family permease